MEELYDAEILAFDRFFADFIRDLREMGIYDQSLIVFLSDHGEEFFEHGGWAHCHSLYEEVIRVPLYFKFPGQRNRGRKITGNAGLIDVFPTLLDQAGMPVPAGVDGESLLPLLRGEPLQRRNLLSSTTVAWLVKQIPPRFSVLDGRLKLISTQPYTDEARAYFSVFGGPPEEDHLVLYNLENDPLEMRALSGDERQKALSGMIDDLNRLKRLIPSIMRKKREKNITMTEEEKRKLQSLGYL
jgi:arylsulfatase A-like enzyme